MSKNSSTTDYNLEKLEIYKTELEAQNEELREKEYQLSKNLKENEILFFDAPIPYIIIDSEFKIIKYNNCANSIFNLDSKPFRKKMFILYFDSKDIYILTKWIKNKEYLKESITLKMRILDKYEKFKIHATKSSIQHNTYMISMISIQKEIDLFDESKKKDQLILAQSKMASLGEMLNNISHQWRQPLSAITSATSALKVEKELDILDDMTLNKLLDSITQNAQFLSKTINDFRNFALQKYENEEFDIKESIEKVVAILKSKLINKNIELISNLETQKYNGSESQLMQVLINLINNSIDQFDTNYSSKKIIYIANYLKNEEQIIDVIDNAGGIDPAIINRIFEPYFTTKHQNIGTGIGLYMSIEIIEKQFKGNLSAKNTYLELKNNQSMGALFKISFHK